MAEGTGEAVGIASPKSSEANTGRNRARTGNDQESISGDCGMKAREVIWDILSSYNIHFTGEDIENRLSNAGFVILPKEADKTMIEAADKQHRWFPDWQLTYAAMRDAYLKGEGE
jgi:hypothetical protein